MSSRSSLAACRAVCSRNFMLAASSAAAFVPAFSARTCTSEAGSVQLCERTAVQLRRSDPSPAILLTRPHAGPLVLVKQHVNIRA